MLFSPRIPTRRLAELARRLATSLAAGVDARTVFAREVDRASGRAAREAMEEINQAIRRGQSVAEGLDASGDYFPRMFREMVRVGEQTGQLSETLVLLATHYEGQVRLNRTFAVALVWPAIELGIALCCIGFLIWFSGVIGRGTDILGWGLTGTAGLLTYAIFVGGIFAGVWLLYRAGKRGVFWLRPVQKLFLVLPGIGKPLQTICLARLAWAMHLTFNTGMDVPRAIRLSLQATNNARYTEHIRRLERAAIAGEPLSDAFARTGVFPNDFLDSLLVAEESGQVAETMARLSEQYRHQAEAAMRVLAIIGGFTVWVAIAAFIIFLIFSLAMSYVSTINSILN